MRLSRILRRPDAPTDDTVPVRRMVLWALVGAAILVGIALYFRYQRTLTPLVG